MGQVQPADISRTSGTIGAEAWSLPAASWHGERSMADHNPRFRDDQRPNDPQSGRGPFHADESSTLTSTTGRELWRASASFGWLIGTLLLLLAGAGIVLLLVRVPTASGGQRVTWIALAAALTALTVGIAVLLRALPTMRYRFANDTLVVEWLGQRRVVPLAAITDITFEPAQKLKLPGWEPFWPGYYVATVRTPSGTWHSWATQQPHRRVRLTTAQGIVAISPERPVRFVAELERRRGVAGLSASAGEPVVDEAPVPAVAHPPMPMLSDKPVREIPASEGVAQSLPKRPIRRPLSPDRGGRQRGAVPSARNPIVRWLLNYRDLFRDQFLTDQVASALVAVGVVLPVLMVAYLYSQYEGLPGQIPIQWDASNDIVEMTTPSGLWRFPRIAVAILVVNTALATLVIGIDRYLARLLVAGIPLSQVILFIALIRAVS